MLCDLGLAIFTQQDIGFLVRALKHLPSVAASGQHDSTKLKAHSENLQWIDKFLLNNSSFQEAAE